MSRQNKGEELSSELQNNPLIQSSFDVRDLELQKPVVFQASFNRFEHMNLSQAWSLWLTGCRTDDLFGLQSLSGRMLTLLVLTILLLIAQQAASVSP